MLRGRGPPVTIIRELRDEDPFSVADIMRGQKFLYLLQAGPFVKIGISNDVEARAASIRTGFPYRVDIVKRWKTPFAREIEGQAHSLLERYWQSGEWFTIPPRVATIILNILVLRKPRTRIPKQFKSKSLLFCSVCQDHEEIKTMASERKPYFCRRCKGEMQKYYFNLSAKIYREGENR